MSASSGALKCSASKAPWRRTQPRVQALFGRQATEEGGDSIGEGSGPDGVQA